MASGQRPRIDPRTLLNLYRQGYFPMADPDTGEVNVYSADPRAIIPLDAVHISSKIARLVRRAPFEVRCDTAFVEVMRACALPRAGSDRTWINEAMVEPYAALFEAGYAHSVEAWRGGALVGGLYGVHIGGLFCGESMFHRPDLGGSDASKISFVHLVRWLNHRGFGLLDAQMKTPHTARFGCIEVSHREYLGLLARALRLPVTWGDFRAL